MHVEIIEVGDGPLAILGAAQRVQQIVGGMANMRVLRADDGRAYERKAAGKLYRLQSAPPTHHAGKHPRIGAISDHSVTFPGSGARPHNDPHNMIVVDSRIPLRCRQGIG